MGGRTCVSEVPSLLQRMGLGRFGRQVFTIASGAAAGQIVLLAAAPVLARLYNPTEFGAFAAWVSIIAIVGAVSTLRFHLAVVLPESADKALHAVALCLLTVATATALFELTIPWVGRPLLALVDAPSLQPLLWLLPVSVAAVGISATLTCLASRQERFGVLGGSRASEGAGKAAAQIGLGFAGLGGAGLIIGDAVARMLGAAVLAVGLWRNGLANVARTRWAEVTATARRYVDFARFGAPSQLLNSAGLQLPPLLFAASYGLEVAGIVALAQRVVLAPLVFVGQAASQVYHGTGGRLSREDPRGLRSLFVQTSVRLLALGVVPMALLAAFGPFLFTLVFGDEWTESGQYARLLVPAFLVQLVVSPLSQTLNILERQRWQLAWDVVRLALVVGAIVGSAALSMPPRTAVIAYSAGATVAYLIHHLMGWLAIRSLNAGFVPDQGPSSD